MTPLNSAYDVGMGLHEERCSTSKDALGKHHEALTGKVIEAAMAVSNELGAGFAESVYQAAFLIAMRDLGLEVMPQARMRAIFRGQIVGEFIADYVVENRLVVEIKAVNAIANEHLAQVINYLRASDHMIGLLFNFGRPRLEIRRLLAPRHPTHPIHPS